MSKNKKPSPAQASNKQTPEILAETTRLNINFWNRIFYNRSADFTEILKCITELEHILENAHKKQDYQAINDLEFALGMGPFGYNKRFKTSPYPDLNKFNKTMAKNLSIELGKNLLPYAANCRSFLINSREKTIKPVHKYSPEEFIYIPFISKREILPVFDKLLTAWRTLPSSVKKEDCTAEYSVAEIVTGIMNQTSMSFAVVQTDELKAPCGWIDV